jgi:hypothetical protein
MGLSRRAYAALREVHESAVRKAIATGRITTEADGTIDAAKADDVGCVHRSASEAHLFLLGSEAVTGILWGWCRKPNSGFATPPLDWIYWAGLHWHG